jgi:hypothetical protein
VQWQGGEYILLSHPAAACFSNPRPRPFQPPRPVIRRITGQTRLWRCNHEERTVLGAQGFEEEIPAQLPRTRLSHRRGSRPLPLGRWRPDKPEKPARVVQPRAGPTRPRTSRPSTTLAPPRHRPAWSSRRPSTCRHSRRMEWFHWVLVSPTAVGDDQRYTKILSAKFPPRTQQHAIVDSILLTGVCGTCLGLGLGAVRGESLLLYGLHCGIGYTVMGLASGGTLYAARAIRNKDDVFNWAVAGAVGGATTGTLSGEAPPQSYQRCVSSYGSWLNCLYVYPCRL